MKNKQQKQRAQVFTPNNKVECSCFEFPLILYGCCWLYTLFFHDFLVVALFIFSNHALNIFLECFQMGTIADAQLTATNAVTSCPTATIMSVNNSSGSSASTHHHHQHNTHGHPTTFLSPKTETVSSPAAGESITTTGSMATSKGDEEDSSNAASSDCKSPGQRYVNLRLWFIFISTGITLKKT